MLSTPISHKKETYGETMKINKYGILLLVLLVLCLGIASATVTVVTPASGGTLSGADYHWNATFSGTFTNVTNCTAWAKSSSTADSTYAAALNATPTSNLSMQVTFLNGTFNSWLLEDSNDYSFLVACYNISDVNENSSVVTVTVGNTNPDTPTITTPTSGSTDTDGSVAFSVGVNGTETTGCTLFFSGINPGASSYTMTHSADTCTYTHSTIPEQTYQWYVRASDGTDTTDSGTWIFNVDVKTSAGKAAVLAQQPGVTSEGGALLSVTEGVNGIVDSIPGGTTTIVIVIIIVVLTIIIYKRK